MIFFRVQRRIMKIGCKTVVHVILKIELTRLGCLNLPYCKQHYLYEMLQTIVCSQ